MTPMIKVAITGGIGSGKSYVSKILTERYHIPVYNADDEAKRLMVSNGVIRSELIKLLGPDAYHADGSLNKPLLSSYLFSLPEHVNQINGIVHPQVRLDFYEWADSQSKKGYRIVAIESAILYEAKFEDTVDDVIMVYAPISLRLKRAMARDGATASQIRSRMRQQLADSVKKKKARFVIYNDERHDLGKQIEEVVTTLMNEKMND